MEDLCSKREELNRQIKQEEEEKERLQHDIGILSEKLKRVDESLAQRRSARSTFDRTIAETEAAYTKCAGVLHVRLACFHVAVAFPTRGHWRLPVLLFFFVSFRSFDISEKKKNAPHAPKTRERSVEGDGGKKKKRIKKENKNKKNKKKKRKKKENKNKKKKT
ncbi:Sjoegren syndrome nuclear autoantigen 1 [Liparis tanakae]|uniref:Sjoegren syndrome nuclear autoantigen 1 n=1 Tax=Liparis tanakae TaxID=230148 RepID=A0A4Z2H276_9TELE|nr:Sjoegren syndrome nuclear autoantigen 1 [Liparis tanakae]